jgi:Protein of unknown function (DUF1549)
MQHKLRREARREKSRPTNLNPIIRRVIGLCFLLALCLLSWQPHGEARMPASPTADVNEKSNHWAFLAPVRPPLPEVSRSAWVRTPIDSFILAVIEKANLAPAAEADKATLIRRLSLDLIGLPPTLKEIDEFVADTSPDAYEKLVERMLASPHYGERWGRHWLDVARYADTNGFEKDRDRSIWPYRDWVIKAINQDMPFDRFTNSPAICCPHVRGARSISESRLAFCATLCSTKRERSNPNNFASKESSTVWIRSAKHFLA